MLLRGVEDFEGACRQAKQSVLDALGRELADIFKAGHDARRKSRPVPSATSSHARSSANLGDGILDTPLA